MNWSVIIARIAEKSMPPNGGINPLNILRYGSVIELIVLRNGLLQSRFGNQLRSIRINSAKE